MSVTDDGTSGGTRGSLLRSDLPDWRNNACFQPDPPLHVYASGFLEGARVLRDEVLHRHGLVDSLVFPLIFCYRHYLELALKGFIATGRDLFGDQPAFAETHGLLRLWQEARPLLDRLEPPVDYAEVARAEGTISKLNELDRTGEAFRYPFGTQKSGAAPLLPRELIKFNVRHFSDQIEGVGNFLTGVSEMVLVYLGDRPAADT